MAVLLWLLGLTLARGCHIFEAKCCHIDAKDPSYAQVRASGEDHVPGWDVVDLDLPPAERWAHLVGPLAGEIRTMIKHFKSLLGGVSREIFKLLEGSSKAKGVCERVLAAMGEYGLEIRGIANATGIPVEELLVYNMAYELEGGCTSVVAQDAQGHVLHGRNLDFGLFLGEDWRHLQWTLTEDLRPLLRNVRFVRRNATIFNSTVFLGYVGTLTAVKRGAFSVTVNTRYDKSDWAALKAFLEGKGGGSFLSLLLRDAMVQKGSFSEALAALRSAPLLGPAYVILGGLEPNEGAILERSAQGLVNATLLSQAAERGVNSIVQTNWDYAKDPWYDNRRLPAEYCLRRFNEQIDFADLFSVLAAHPNRNRLTTYTALMDPRSGDLEAYFQYCSEPSCAPWMEMVV